MGVKVGGARFIAKITIKELESLTTNDAGRISVRKDGVSVTFFLSLSVGRPEQRVRVRNLAAQIPDGHPQGS